MNGFALAMQNRDKLSHEEQLVVELLSGDPGFDVASLKDELGRERLRKNPDAMMKIVAKVRDEADELAIDILTGHPTHSAIERLKAKAEPLFDAEAPNHLHRDCRLCQQPTIGSVGAAGFVWTKLCQTCKDNEDNALARRAQLIAAAVETVR